MRIPSQFAERLKKKFGICISKNERKVMITYLYFSKFNLHFMVQIIFMSETD